MFAWNERPYRLESTTTVNDKPVFKIGSLVITIEPDGAITYFNERHRTSNPRATLPNMEITDGEIRIPVSDLVSEMLGRLSAVDIATELWKDQEVRDAFTEAMAHGWNAIEDADRSKLLHAIKERIHDRQIGALTSQLQSLEHDLRRRWFFFDQACGANRMLHDVEERLRQRFGAEDIELPRVKTDTNDADGAIGGKLWDEARVWWRAEIEKRFPGPAEPLEPAPAEGAVPL